jgi:hypothetical protein
MTPTGPVRVLHLRDSPWVDGPGRTILETATHIDRARIDYHIGPLVADDGAQHPLVVAARSRSIPVQPIHDPGDSVAALTDRVIDVIDRLGVQILHSSEFRTNVVALRCRKKRPALRIVSTALTWGAQLDLAQPGLARTRYIAALQAADQGDYAPLLTFANS